MHRNIMEQFTAILKEELKPALGCTEPIAIALASAKARTILGGMPEGVEILLSGNVIKNVKGVIVPNSGGEKGIEMAAALGLFSGNPEKRLRVLEDARPDHVREAHSYIREKRFTVDLVPEEDGLYVEIRARRGTARARVIFKEDHSVYHILERDGIPLASEGPAASGGGELPPVADRSLLSVERILEYAESVSFTEEPELRALLNQQINHNFAIAKAGIHGNFAAQVGKTVLSMGNPEDPKTMAKAYTAAGSDARMGGCSCPVYINSGSGNQGMTVSIPVIVFARHRTASEETLHRALMVSNLVAIHQKRFIGKLSAFCGVVSAAAAAGSGIAYLEGADLKGISIVIVNTLMGTGGMLCDGAKPSCALKIAMALENMFFALEMSHHGIAFAEGDGLVGEGVEESIRNIGRAARQGMRGTDIEILNIMTGK